jgi:GPH family glycoside/pentoside/hexuronide:cation symporter
MTLPLSRLAAYALPALPLAVLTLPLYIVVPTYYASALGVPLAAVGQALLLVRIFDAVSDPVVGILADRTRPRFGRRRTWFLASVPVTVVAVWLLFVPPAGAGAGWLFGFGLLLSLGTTASLIPYWAWGAELATDYSGRNRVAAARETLVVVGTLVATATPAIATAMGAGADGGAALAMLAAFVAVMLPLTTVAAVALVPEPPEYSKARLGLRPALASLGRNRPFLRLLAAFVLNGFANGLPATLFLFFVNERLQAPDQAGLLLFTYFLCGVAGVPLWLWIAQRFGKHRTWCAAMIGNAAVFAAVPLLGPGDAGIFLAICVVTGVALGADLVLPSSIQADVIDVGTAESGEQRTGTYVAAWGLGTKLALALAVGIAFPVLDWAGFSADGGPQTDFGLSTLSMLYAGVPVAAKLAAVALMWHFPIGAAEQARLRAAIEADAQRQPVERATSLK